MKEIKIVAHRGGYKESVMPENSKEAISYAILKKYIDGVEFDIRITKDKKIVLIHNASIKYRNKRYKVSTTNYQQLNEVYFKLYHVKLNTLDEILAMIPKEKMVFLEVKNMENLQEKENLVLIENTLKKYSDTKIILISFLYKYLRYFGAKGYPTCLLINRESKFFELKTYFKLYLTLKLTMISINKGMAHKKLVNKILKSNKLLGIYTIDSEEEIHRIFHNMGMEMVRKYQNKIYITTTNPKKVSERIKKLNEKD